MLPLDLERRKRLFHFTAGSLGASAGFLLAIGLVGRFIVDHPESPGVRWLAVPPIVALVAVMVLAVRCLHRSDELERKIHTEAMAVALLGSILLVSTHGLLALADLPTFPVLWLPPVMVGCWVIGLLVAIVRYR